MAQSTIEHAARNARPDCPKCAGTGLYMYDRDIGTVCNLCCRHDLGWDRLEKYYGEDNGKWCCLAGCGKTVTNPPSDDTPTKA